MAATQKNRLIGIDTALGADVLLLKSFSLNEQLGRSFQIEAELVSEKPDVDFDALVGTNATIRLNTPPGGKRFFNGIINRFSQTGNEGNFATYRATLVPWLWLLTRTANCRIFQNKKVPDIIEAVFKAHGFKDYKLKLSGTYREWEYCVQYRETDFNFVSRLMEQEGMYYYFEHVDKVHTLVLIDSAGAHDPFPAYATLTYRPRTQAQEGNSETVTDWLIEREVQPGLWALADFNFKAPTPIRVNANISRSHEHAGFEIYDYPGEYTNRQEGDAYAKLRIQEVQARHEILRGQSTVHGASAGYKFTLKGHFRADQNRAYLTTGISLQASTGSYESAAGEGSDFFACGLVAIPFVDPFRTVRSTPKPLIQGPQTAIVSGRGEIDPDEFGRVKVQFHWDREGKSDQNSSCWVRVSQVWAGKNWGAIHTPRIGQEVIVEFLEGDPDRPIITGRVYNAAQTVPYALPANKTQSGIKSRSSEGGAAANFNEIRFEDKMGSEQVYIHAEKNQDNIVENDETTQVGHDRTEKVGHDETIHIGHDRTEKVEHDEILTIGHDQTETVENNRVVKIVANHTENIGDSMSITVGSSLTETVGVNYAETVGAAMELTVGAALAITVGAAMAETVGGAKVESVGLVKSENVGGNRSLNVGGDKSETIAKNRIVSVTKDQKTTIGGQQKIAVTKESILNAKKVQIVAEDEIQLKTGSAEITLKKNGDILINGKKIEIKGSGDVVLKGSQIKEN